MNVDEIFYYDQEKKVPVSTDPEIKLLGKSEFGREEGGITWMIEFRDKKRAISMYTDYIPCEYGKLRIRADGVSRKYGLFWNRVHLRGSYYLRDENGEYVRDERGYKEEVHSEPFLTEKERREFIPIAIAFLKKFRDQGMPVVKIEFVASENIQPQTIEVFGDERW